MEDSLMGHDRLNHRPMLEGKARALCLSGETTGTVSSVESDSCWANTAFSCNSTAKHAHWRQNRCFQQVLWPVQSTSRTKTLYAERRHWNENKGGQSAHNQVRLCKGLLDKLLVTAWMRKSLCDEAMLYHAGTLFYSAQFWSQTSFDKREGQKCRDLMANQNKHSNLDCLVDINKHVKFRVYQWIYMLFSWLNLYAVISNIRFNELVNSESKMCHTSQKYYAAQLFSTLKIWKINSAPI